MLYVWLLAVAACFTLLSVGYRQTNRKYMVVAGIFLFLTGLAPYVGQLIRAMGIS